ncbi:DUF554 domain-containing protein [Ferroacidibacillus organovorans]|uniref:DUF554 domain-containing protein n=1 Tax=Ferroacidibacillus organovorans TaxID=1765683 RepID=A0A853K965_9BACL|nr:DUF554 domain-containing protein [Ferroacidibacillus organovorans]KYP80774.1 hypothetical protein AYJ22_09860 [Ferroacidibacillus organovorans]OAG93556.1 hypothetical protein AYW79_10015 [Ferroacidibacillus organovorans]
MFFAGPIVNTAAILIGTFIGAVFHRIPERLKITVMQGMGIFVAVLGVSMALQAPGDTLYVVLSIVVGGVIGSLFDLEGKLEMFGSWLESKLGHSGGKLSQAFVFASLVYGVGSMAILGSIQSGVSGKNTILYLKSALDGFSSVIFTSTMGIGIGLSAFPILLYEGGLAAIAHYFGAHLRNAVIISDVTAVGGILIVGIGLNVLEIAKIRVGNLLPSMFVVALFRYIGLHLGSVLSFLHI